MCCKDSPGPAKSDYVLRWIAKYPVIQMRSKQKRPAYAAKLWYLKKNHFMSVFNSNRLSWILTPLMSIMLDTRAQHKLVLSSADIQYLGQKWITINILLCINVDYQNPLEARHICCHLGLTWCQKKPSRSYSEILKINCGSVIIDDQEQIDYSHVYEICVQYMWHGVSGEIYVPRVFFTLRCLGPHLLTRLNFNSNIDN